jgi:hypothetical protein
MPYVRRRVIIEGLVWEPFAGRPGQPPDWGIDEGGYPDQGLPGAPEYPGQPLPRPPWTPRPPGNWLPGGGYPGQGLPSYPDQGLPGFPGLPELPGQPLPRPPRPVYPVVDDPDGLGGHPEVPDLAMTRRIVITDGSDQFTAYVLMPEPPQVEDDYEPRFPPESWRPGTWVAVLYGAVLAWAWVRSITAPERPEHPEREPK